MKACEYMKDGQRNIVIVTGDSNSGKTACARNLPVATGEIVLSETVGLNTLRRLHPDWKNLEIQIPPTVSAFYQLIKGYITKRLDWIFVDTISRFYDLLWKEYLEKKKLEPDYCERQIYRYCLQHFDHFLNLLCDVANSGTNVFLSCHLKLNMEGKEENRVTWYTPDLPGQIPTRVARQVAVICRARKPINLQGEHQLYLPIGRDTGKDILGIFDKGPIPNDFSYFLHSGGTGSAAESIAASVSVSAPKVETSNPLSIPTPEPPTLVSLPPQREEKPSRRTIPRSQLNILEMNRKQCNVPEEAVIGWCKDNYGIEDPKNLTAEAFVALTQYVTSFVPF